MLFVLCLAKRKGQSKIGDRKKQYCECHSNATIAALDTALIEQVMGMKGKSNKGEYKIIIPQNDLNAEVDDFEIIPAMGLSSWVAFTPSTDGAMIMGDIIITGTDLKPVQQEVISQGLSITAIHNHFVRNNPDVMYMHIGGSGNTAAMAAKAKAVLDKVKEIRGGYPDKGNSSSGSVSNTLDLDDLDSLLGYKGEMNKGFYKYTIGQPHSEKIFELFQRLGVSKHPGTGLAWRFAGKLLKTIMGDQGKRSAK